jgi:hypothetical protein
MRRLRRIDAVVPPSELPRLEPEYLETFLDGRCFRARVERDAVLYRYGSTPQQATSTSRPWVNFSEDRLDTSEVIRSLALLDVTGADPGLRDPSTGKPLMPDHADPTWTGHGRGGERPLAWNVASWRATFRAAREFHAWVGLAAPMAFDLYTGKQYRGPGDQLPHIARPGGGSQVLVNRSNLPRLNRIEILALEPVAFWT